LITVPRLALTAGEPAGIGPDLCIQLAQHVQSCQLIIIASPELLEERAKQLNLPVKLIDYNPQMPKAVAEPGTLIVCPESLDSTVQPGILNSKKFEICSQLFTKSIDWLFI
jgi:4-hydroxythreonine-4-phosphate dehydrogenase